LKQCGSFFKAADLTICVNRLKNRKLKPLYQDFDQSGLRKIA